MNIPQKPYLITQATTPTPYHQDELIAKNLQKEQYIGVAILLLSLVAVIGFFSRRFEYALIFALCISLILIIVFVGI